MLGMATKGTGAGNKPGKSDETHGRARERGVTRLVTVELEVALDDALELARHAERRTRKAVITLAIEEYLKKSGFWPPKGA